MGFSKIFWLNALKIYLPEIDKFLYTTTNPDMAIIIQIKIALSKDNVCILIKILAESHLVFDLGDEIDI